MRLLLGFTSTVFVWTLLLAGACPVAAVPITYTEEFAGTGSLGGTSFSNADVLLTFTGDTANAGPVVQCDVDSGLICLNPPSRFVNTTGTTTVAVSGIGTATFLPFGGAIDADVLFIGEPGVFSDPTNMLAGFLGESGSPDIPIVSISDPVFLGYGLDTSIGPVGPDASGFSSGVPFFTTAGDLILTAAGAATFTATDPATAIPEPSSLALLAFGIAGLGLFRSRRRGKRLL